jgi:hypothetical protein
MADSKEMIEWVRINYDQHFKVANLLLAGHGAAIVGCLSVLKDVDESEGVGKFIAVFGFGLLAAMLNYIYLEFGRQHALIAARVGQQAEAKKKFRLMIIYTAAMTISIALMVIAILMLIVHFWGV